MPLITLANGLTVTVEQAITLASLRLVFPEMRWGKNKCGCCVHAHTNLGDFLIGLDGDWDFIPTPDIIIPDIILREEPQ